jgi:hypothetical protein
MKQLAFQDGMKIMFGEITEFCGQKMFSLVDGLGYERLCHLAIVSVSMDHEEL